jgi:hypothetical protein
MADKKEFRQNAYGDFNSGDYVRGNAPPKQPYDVDEDRIEDGALPEPAGLYPPDDDETDPGPTGV